MGTQLHFPILWVISAQIKLPVLTLVSILLNHIIDMLQQAGEKEGFVANQTD
jgi:hypothetical protein